MSEIFEPKDLRVGDIAEVADFPWVDAMWVDVEAVGGCERGYWFVGADANTDPKLYIGCKSITRVERDGKQIFPVVNHCGARQVSVAEDGLLNDNRIPIYGWEPKVGKWVEHRKHGIVRVVAPSDDPRLIWVQNTCQSAGNFLLQIADLTPYEPPDLMAEYSGERVYVSTKFLNWLHDQFIFMRKARTGANHDATERDVDG